MPMKNKIGLCQMKDRLYLVGGAGGGGESDIFKKISSFYF